MKLKKYPIKYEKNLKSEKKNTSYPVLAHYSTPLLIAPAAPAEVNSAPPLRDPGRSRSAAAPEPAAEQADDGELRPRPTPSPGEEEQEIRREPRWPSANSHSITTPRTYQGLLHSDDGTHKISGEIGLEPTTPTLKITKSELPGKIHDKQKKKKTQINRQNTTKLGRKTIFIYTKNIVFKPHRHSLTSAASRVVPPHPFRKFIPQRIHSQRTISTALHSLNGSTAHHC